ncbi:RTP1-C1 domain-containing protein [Phanerochaete sordida]|uniref:RTP1-C1 domain-containing protein n=1 Tax=Phanerochaete sordida TaxID=48140 RepID=A0A9P3FYH2_9APHY|nr:RTP1-C1 domain-containing protein [Phanerochaete sordida]
MSRQILRHGGVRGLFIALFAGEDVSGEDAPFEKLDSVSKLLRSLPAGIDEIQYYGNITQQLLSILSAEDDTPLSHRRAAAFSLSRMLSSENEKDRASTLVSRLLLPTLQRPFLEVTQGAFLKSTGSASAADILRITPSQAIRTLQTLLSNTDPSPELISHLLTPIVPALYALLWALDSIKTSEPVLRTTVRGLLRTWGRLVDGAEGIATLRLVVDGEGGEWRVDIAGEISRVEHGDAMPQLSMFTPEDLQRAEETGEFDMDANILQLRPDPAHFVAFLKSLDRSDIVGELFVRLLESYRESKTSLEADPMRTLLFLQLIVQIQNQLSSGDSAFDILKKPDHILSFIKHALQTATQDKKPPAKRETTTVKQTGLKLADLRIVDVEEVSDDETVEGDSDDEDEPSGPREGSDEDMTSTALNLLLAVMEANPNLNTQTTPILDEIFPLLESLAKNSSEVIKPLAREARMVLTARLASSSMSQAPKDSAKSGESPQETYQKALKLLQDPILPVRAHGLLLLRQLVSARPSRDGTLQEPTLDRALVPGILSILLQSLQDDDSYIFLNAVQGLAAMADGFGRDVLRGLVDAYAAGLAGVGGTALTQLDVDTQTRVGEALGQVIKRCGDALPGYADLLVPPLFGVVRAPHLPTALRTSALSLLAQFANTSAVAVLPYAIDLTGAMLDLLQLESVPAVQKPRERPAQSADVAAEENAVEEGPGMKEGPEKEKPKPKRDAVEYQPTTNNSKIPTLRRSALYFVSLLARAFAGQLEDVSTVAVYALPGELMRKAKTTIGYVAATDEDLVVRVMAKETLEELDSLAEAMLGL